MVQSYAAEEREVHLLMDDVDRVWRADVYIPKYIRMFQKAGWKQISSQMNDKGIEIAATFEAPAHAITIRKAERKKRTLTAEQRAAAAKRMEIARNSINNIKDSA